MTDLLLRPSSVDTIDPVLADLVAEIIDKLHAGQPVDMAEYTARCPEGAEQLQRLLPALELLHSMGSTAGSKSRLSASRDSTGNVLSGTLGDFRLIREVGRGGMGVVYEAEQISLKRRVALKVLPFAAAMDPRHLQRFKNEAQAAACLHHTNIVPVFGVGSDRGVHYYAMQYIDGQPLSAFIDQMRRPVDAQASGGRKPPDEPATAGPLHQGAHAPRSPDTTTRAAAETVTAARDKAYFRRVAEWGIQAAEALEYAHQMGIIHRDIKPANLLLEGEPGASATGGRLWIADFGLAQIQNDPRMTMSGDFLGTLRYMSPEQALGKHGVVDHRTDIYSLGVTLYELVTHQPTYTGKDRQELLKQIAFEEPKRPRQHDKAIPVELETIVLKAIAKNADERFDSAHELTEDLQRWLAGRPIQARPISAAGRAWRWCKRNKGLAGLTAAVVASLLATIASLIAGIVLLSEEKAQTLKEKNSADEQRDLATARARALRRRLYAANVRHSYQAWSQGHIELAGNLFPEASGDTEDEDLRGFEWRYLNNLVHPSDKPLCSWRGHPSEIYDTALTLDGKVLATAGHDPLVRLWNPLTAELLGTLAGHEDGVDALDFSPDGVLLASGGDDCTVRLWDVRSLKELKTLRGHTQPIHAVAFSPNGQVIATGGKDHYVKLWKAASGDLLASWEVPQEIRCLTFSPDGKTLASAYGILSLWAIDWDKTGSTVTQRNTLQFAAWDPFAVRFSPDGRFVATANGDGLIGIHDTATGGYGRFWSQSTTVPTTGLAYMENDKILATAGADGRVRFWDVERQELIHSFSRSNAYLEGLGFTKDRRLFATGRRDGWIDIWGSFGSFESLPLQANEDWSANYSFASGQPVSHDGRLLVKEGPHFLTIYDAATGAIHAELNHLGLLGSLAAFSPDGKTLATALGTEPVRLWQVSTGEQLFALAPRPRFTPTRLAFSHDGRSLAVSGTNSQDAKESIYLWHAASHEERKVTAP